MLAGGQQCLCQIDVRIRWSSVNLLLEGPSTPWHIDALGPPLQGAAGEARVGGTSMCSLGADGGLHLVGAGQGIGGEHALRSAELRGGCACRGPRHAGSLCASLRCLM